MATATAAVAVRLNPKVQWEEDTFQGTKHYNVLGERDVLLIASTEAELPDAVAHSPAQLTENDKRKITDLGISVESCSDAEVILSRYRLEKRFEIVGVEQSTSECPLTTKLVRSKMKQLFNNTEKPGVVLHYHGPGRKDTGDWCFADGFITFQDIADLYMEHFRGSVLVITSDCCYSGSWVKSCGEFLDKQGVRPCAHSARDKGILINVYTSCRGNEVAQLLYFSTRLLQNDKNTKEVFLRRTYAEDLQHRQYIGSANIRCANKAIEQPCTLPPDLTWEKQLAKEEARKRVFLVRGKDGGRPVWHYVLLVDNEETIRAFKEKTQGANAGKFTLDVADYGKVLKSGFGEAPTQEETDKWLSTQDFTTLM